MNVATLLERAAQRTPNAIAIVDERTGATTTYRTFLDQIFATGARLRVLAAGEPGARIAILGDAGHAYLCADYGAMSAGLVRVPLDPHLSIDEAAAQLTDAAASVLLYDEKHAEMAMQLAARSSLTLAPLVIPSVSRDRDEPAAALPPDAIASLNYTGGSTGRPKAVVHTQGSLSAALQNIVMARDNGPGSVFLNVRPLWPIAAIVVLAQFVAGGTVVLGAFAPERFAQQIARFNVNLTSLVPTQLVRILRAIEHPAPVPTLRSIDIGAAALAVDVLEGATAAFGPVIAMLYGLTEAPWCCYRPPEETARIDRNDPQTHGYVGRPLFGVEVQIRTADGTSLPPNEIGDVHVRGGNLMQGYWNQPDLTADVLAGGWLRTGDLGRLDAAGRLYLAGRSKMIIRTGGKSVQPDEVENVLLGHPAVAEAAVVGIPDTEWGEVVVAAVSLNPNPAADALADIMRHCREALSSYKRPKQIRIVEALPRSHYGKIQTSKVRDLFDPSS